MKNIVYLEGFVTELKLSHYGDKQYGIIEISRESGNVDKVPFVYEGTDLELGWQALEGKVETRNKVDKNGSRHKYMFVRVKKGEVSFRCRNEVSFEGYLVSKDVLRETPRGKIVMDAIFAVNEDRKSYYPSVVCWYGFAFILNDMKIGDKAFLTARFQSREYAKKLEDKEFVRTAYELSVKDIAVEEKNVD